ncbi:head-tail adaptor protein [Clostridium tertium]|uniref:head-tail adaptor protein n=1 Tax=Clostridium tertium TaxID=1559 RepID=UPI0024B3B3AC|nr:head-tail adaptor protein [Clostridium tertium]MDI9216000.1 head-tail adaptor protein [Clostridium tertium]
MNLNTRIDFIFEKNITDEDGFKTFIEDTEDTGEVVYSCWANRKVLSASKEFLASGTNNYKEIVSFGIRYCPFVVGLDTLCYKIQHNKKNYNIIQIDDTSREFIYIKGENINGQ